MTARGDVNEDRDNDGEENRTTSGGGKGHVRFAPRLKRDGCEPRATCFVPHCACTCRACVSEALE